MKYTQIVYEVKPQTFHFGGQVMAPGKNSEIRSVSRAVGPSRVLFREINWDLWSDGRCMAEGCNFRTMRFSYRYADGLQVVLKFLFGGFEL